MNTSGGIAALILAAGYSARLGAFKPLLPLGGATIIEEVVQRFRTAGIEDIRVVTGHRAEELTPVLDNLEVREIFNPDFHQGMLASVRAGVRSLEPGVTAFFLQPVDVPLVKPRTVTCLLHRYRRGEARIVYPCFQGLRGHPPLISRTCVADLPLDWEGGFGAFLSRYDGEALDLEVIDEAVLLDCDTPEDYCRLLSQKSREDLPTGMECQAIWDRRRLPESVRRHSRMVAGVAGILANHLNFAGLQLAVPLAVAAGYLHDLAKGQPDHAGVGAGILEDLGYSRVAQLVASHKDIQVDEQSITETEVLYLADKFIAGDRLVTLKERFCRALEKFGDQPEALAAIDKRLKDAQLIQGRMEEALGISLEELLQRYEKSLPQVAVAGPRRIYLVRHGEVETPGKGKRYLGHLDIPLSAAGCSQAGALRERLRGVPLSAVFCSDLKRTVKTAAIIAAPHGLNPEGRREFREIALGSWEGLTFEEVRQRFPQEYEARGRDFTRFRPPGGESFLDLANRVLPAFYEAIGCCDGDIVVVGHAGVNRILLSLALGRSLAAPFEIPQDYGCLNLLRYRDFGLDYETINATL
jgi:molybdenum cofactor cytidylyltransferase